MTVLGCLHKVQKSSGRHEKKADIAPGVKIILWLILRYECHQIIQRPIDKKKLEVYYVFINKRKYLTKAENPMFSSEIMISGFY